MCLEASVHCFRYAEKDIECYKVISFEDGKYETPYRMVFIEKEVISGKKEMSAIGRCNTFLMFGKRYIDSGYIHTFSSYPKSWMNKYNKNNKFVVFKCIIPKGTRYAKGIFSHGECFESYASKKLKFIEEVIE